MHNPEYIPDKEIRKLIVLNPWTAISSPPLIQVVKDGNNDTEIMIGFKIINMKEGKMIEQRILEFLRKSGNQVWDNLFYFHSSEAHDAAFFDRELRQKEAAILER